MLDSRPSAPGTLIIIALLILSLFFAGLWIVFAVSPGSDPHILFPWFGIAAAVIVVLGLLMYLRRPR